MTKAGSDGARGGAKRGGEARGPWPPICGLAPLCPHLGFTENRKYELISYITKIAIVFKELTQSKMTHLTVLSSRHHIGYCRIAY